VTERDTPQDDDVTLAEIELESDVMDADVEGIGPTPERPPHEQIRPAHDPPKLDEADLVEAEAEADVMDADIEGS
jgi:hypothetical protein